MRIVVCLCLCLLSLLFTSCLTTIPAHDTVLPTFVFRVNGDGFNTEITENFDFDNSALYLRRDAYYNTFFIAADPGGVKGASMTIPISTIIDTGRKSGPYHVANASDPYKIKYACSDCSDNVRTRSVLTFHRMHAKGGPLDGTITNYEFVFSITDYHDNTLEKTLIVRITNEPTGIRSRD